LRNVKHQHEQESKKKLKPLARSCKKNLRNSWL